MSKSKGPKTPPRPVPRLQDMSISDISKMNVEAIERGDVRPLLDVMKASIDPDPKSEPPTSYLVIVPLLARDGVSAVGASMQVAYPGHGIEGELRMPSGESFKVNLLRFASVLDALRSAVLSAPPPMVPGYGRGPHFGG
jgi:hypothetical protein